MPCAGVFCITEELHGGEARKEVLIVKKDFYEKKLEDYKDVFADIINVLLFNGKRRVREDDLEHAMVRSGYFVEGRFDGQERDAKKRWKSSSIEISAVFGLENQTGSEPAFAVRTIAYDGADYRDQEEELPVPEYYPVITLVLYFSDRRWSGSRNIKDYLNIPEGLEQYVPDYVVNVFEIGYLTDRQVEMFQSDFRFVAEYFVGIRKRKEGLIPEFHYPAERMKHVEAVMELMRALTNSKWFDKLPDLVGERGGVMFTEIFEVIEEKGIKKGIEQGIKQGIVSGKESANLRVAKDMLRRDEPLDKIVSYSTLDEGRIRKLAGTLGVSVKECDGS